MNRIIKILMIAIVSIMVISCKNYLDLKPYGRTVPKTAEEYSALLHGILDEAMDYGKYELVGSPSMMADLECYADNLETTLTKYPEGNSLSLYAGARVSTVPSQIYFRLYEYIRSCNIVIDNIQERDTRQGKDILGTAYIIRGVCYYQLLKYFAPAYDPSQKQLGLPIVTTFNMEEKATRSTIKETAKLIEEDLKKGISYDVQDKVYLFNSDVAKGFLARLYFWMEDYSSAIVYAGELLEKYPLIEGEAYKAMMTSEVMQKGNIIIKSLLTNDASGEDAMSNMRRYLTARPLSKRFVSLFDEKDDDIRYSLWFSKIRVSRKYILACMRSAEMSLILAESFYHENNPTQALFYLNELRKKRIANYTDLTTVMLAPVDASDVIKVDAKGNALTPLISAILNERRKELYMEGDRWFELKRNGSPELWVSKNGFKYTTYPYMYTFPFPIKDVLLVDGLVQNPGYEQIY